MASALLLPLLGRTGGRTISAIGGGRRGTDALSGVHAAARRSIIDLSYSAHFMDFKGSSIPSSMKKLVVTKLSPNFREAVSAQTVAVPTPGDADLLVRNRKSWGGSDWHPEMEMMEKEMQRYMALELQHHSQQQQQQKQPAVYSEVTSTHLLQPDE